MDEPITDDCLQGKSESLGCLPYVIGGASFIPLLGIPIGLIVIIWGIVKRKAGGLKLALVGTFGILFTIILYGNLFYKEFTEKEGIYDDLKGQGSSLSITTKGGDGIFREALWYVSNKGFEPLYWLREEIPIEKRIAVLEHSLGRLKFTQNTYPELNKRISISGKDLSFTEITEKISEIVGKELPLEFAGNNNLTFDLEVENFQVYVILEDLIESTSDNIIYLEDRIKIQPIEQIGGHRLEQE